MTNLDTAEEAGRRAAASMDHLREELRCNLAAIDAARRAFGLEPSQPQPPRLVVIEGGKDEDGRKTP